MKYRMHMYKQQNQYAVAQICLEIMLRSISGASYK
jgi:hypothetical protein